QAGATAFAFAERPLIQLRQQPGDRLVDLAEREELLFAQRGDDPALHYLYAHFRLRFIFGPIRPRRNDGHAVVLAQIAISGVQIRFVVARMGDGGLQVIRHHDLGHAAEILERPDMGTGPAPQILPRRSFGKRIAAGAQHGHEHGSRMDFAGRGIVNRNRRAGVIDEHLFARAVCLPQHQIEFLQPTPVQIAEPAVAVALGIALTPFLPDQLQRQILVGLEFLVDTGPVRLRMLAPDLWRGPLRKQRLSDLSVIPAVWQWPLYASRLGGGNVIVDGALRDRTTAGDLMLAHPEGMEPQYFLQLAHGQPFLWQRGFSTYQWSPPPRPPCAAVPIPCRSVF